MNRSGLLLVAAAAGILSLAAESLASIATRYEAVISVCAARRAAGLLSADEESLCREILEARRGRRNQRLEILLERATRLFAARIPDPAGWQITIGPDLGVLRVDGESAPVSARLLGDGVEFAELDASLVDDMAVYVRLREGDSLVYLAPTPHAGWEDRARDLVPPPGWEEQTSVVDRWQKLALTAGSPVVVTGPGIHVDHPGIAEWLRAETRSKPRRPICLAGDNLMRLKPYLPFADTWILRIPPVDPKDETREVSIVDALWLLLNIRTPGVGVVMPIEAPWFNVVRSSLDELGNDAIRFAPRTRDLAGISAPGLMLVVNPSPYPRRIHLEPTPLPAASASVEADFALEATLTILDDDGESIERHTRRNATLIRLELPPRSMGFVHLAWRSEAR
jgi:hypothetical protein